MTQRVRGGPEAAKRLKYVDTQVFTTQDCVIEFPTRYMERDLGDIGEQIMAYGLLAIIFGDNKYVVLNICAKVQLFPHSFSKVLIDDVEYYRFVFKANTPLFNKVVVRNDLLMHDAMDEFYFNGKVPWFVDYDLKCKLFDTASSHAASNVASNLQTIEFISSFTTRDVRDRTKLLRHTAKSAEDFKKYKADIPLGSVYYGVVSPMGKVSGAYFRDGIISSLVTPGSEADSVEQVLRA